jgi:hypothetical protein
LKRVAKAPMHMEHRYAPLGIQLHGVDDSARLPVGRGDLEPDTTRQPVPPNRARGRKPPLTGTGHCLTMPRLRNPQTRGATLPSGSFPTRNSLTSSRDRTLLHDPGNDHGLSPHTRAGPHAFQGGCRYFSFSVILVQRTFVDTSSTGNFSPGASVIVGKPR